MRIRRTKMAAVVLFVVVGLVAGCGRSSLRIGWRAFDGPRRRSASYSSFSGVERGSFRTEAGRMIELDYDVEVEGGLLTIELLDPDGDRVFHRSFREAASDVVFVSAPRSGRYQLRIEGEGTKGSYEVSWDVGDA